MITHFAIPCCFDLFDLGWFDLDCGGGRGGFPVLQYSTNPG